MDIRIDVKFKFEENYYNADILILKLSTSPLKFYYVVHLFDDLLTSQFSMRYILKTKENKFLPVSTRTAREKALVLSIQSAIKNHKYNPAPRLN